MTSWIDFWSTDSIGVSPRCNFRCRGCSLWQISDKGSNQKDEFKFKLHHKQSLEYGVSFKRPIHIVGGEPTSESQFPLLLEDLHKKSKEVHGKGKDPFSSFFSFSSFLSFFSLISFYSILTFFSSERQSRSPFYLWTNGSLSLDVMEKLLPFIDKLFLYFPTPDATMYQDITGESQYNHLLNVVDLCKEMNTPVILNHYSQADTVATLPDTYEIAYQKKVPLLIHYDHHTDMSRESIAYIKRFYHVNNVWVFKNKKVLPSTCPGVSSGFIYSKVQWMINNAYSLKNSLRIGFKL